MRILDTLSDFSSKLMTGYINVPFEVTGNSRVLTFMAKLFSLVTSDFVFPVP